MFILSGAQQQLIKHKHTCVPCKYTKKQGVLEYLQKQRCLHLLPPEANFITFLFISFSTSNRIEMEHINGLAEGTLQ